MAINQQTIAERLGLSISTVSLALRDAPQVAEETRHHVRAVAEELGYKLRARRPARSSLLPTTLEQITMLMRHEPTNSFYGGVLAGVESECRKHHIALHYRMLDELTPRTLAQYEESDGLLLAGVIDEEVVVQLQGLGRPLVLVDNDLPHLGLDRVLTENLGGVYRAVMHLVSWGHRRIAVLGAPAGDPNLDARLAGYRRAMARGGLTPVEITTRGAPWPRGPEQGLAFLSDWLASDQARGVTAIVAMNDESAIAALHTIQDHGLRVPEEISLVGFDDVAPAQMVRPALTTSQVPRERLGQIGVRLLLERARSPEAPTQALVQDTTFIERASTRRLA